MVLPRSRSPRPPTRRPRPAERDSSLPRSGHSGTPLVDLACALYALVQCPRKPPAWYVHTHVTGALTRAKRQRSTRLPKFARSNRDPPHLRLSISLPSSRRQAKAHGPWLPRSTKSVSSASKPDKLLRAQRCRAAWSDSSPASPEASGNVGKRFDRGIAKLATQVNYVSARWW